MSVGNIKEQFLYALLPDAILTQDTRGYIEAVVSGYQDRLDDLRSYTSKLDAFWTPGALPDGARNVVLVDLTSAAGKTYTRSLEINFMTPPDGSPLLPRWVANQLGVAIDDLGSVRYGYDALRAVDANMLTWLAATLGTLLYQTDLMPGASGISAAQVALVNTWFPRLKIKGTAQSFEVLGRILGFDDVRVTPLWTRLSPRVPADVGAAPNDPDFVTYPEYFPQQQIGPFYDPFAYRDGPYFTWTGTASNGTSSTQFYSETVSRQNPWIEVVLLGSLAGTNIPAVSYGTVVHPATGSYTLAGGAPYTKAKVDPPGSSVRFQAVAEGDAFNGVNVSVINNGSMAVLTVVDQLSAAKYRSSYFDLGLTADMDKIEDIFGSRAATTNKDLRATPALTSDGTAVSPYRPWVSGSIAVVRTNVDWITVDGSISSTVSARHEANPFTDRQLNMDAVVVAGVQVTQAFEEVRAATRLPRRSQTGFLIDDRACYAPYTDSSVLFTTVSGGTGYSGSSHSSPLPGYVAGIQVVLPSGTMVLAKAEVNPLNQNEYLYGGTYPAASYAISGSYDFSTGSYAFRTSDLAGAVVSAQWSVTTTDVIRPEPSGASKAADEITCLGRPEDSDDDGIVYEVADDFPWRREVVVGGELVELDTYQSGSEIDVVEVEEATAFNDQTGIDVNVFAAVSKATPHPRVIQMPRSNDTADYRPGQLAIGYSGELKSLSSLTAGETTVIRLPVGASKGDTETDYDVLFSPGYGLYHVGIAQGVLVADLMKFFGLHHSQKLVGWYPFNEHPEDAILVADRSAKQTVPAQRYVMPSDRHWDDVRGWCLSLHSDARIDASAYYDVDDEISISFWFKLQHVPNAETTIVSHPKMRFALRLGSKVRGYVKNDDGSETSVAMSSLFTNDGQWHFYSMRRSLTQVTFGECVLGGAMVETTLPFSTTKRTPESFDNLFVKAERQASFLIHDLRIWNKAKTTAETALAAYHAPNKTLCTYRLGFMYTVDRQDKFGIKVLPSGWAVPDVLPAWYRRTRQGLVTRYDSMGSYSGETRFKETGIGGGRPLPDTYKLGQQFVHMVADGTAQFSTDSGQLPGWNSFWQLTNQAGQFDRLPFSGSAATGIVPVSTASGTVSPWPNTMAQFNPFRQYVYVSALQGSDVYQLSLDGDSSATWLSAEQVVHGRTVIEVMADPYISTLISSGTVYVASGTGFIKGTVVGTSGTYGFYDPVTTVYQSKTFNTADLGVKEQPTGAYTLLSNTNGVLLAHTGSNRGVAGPYTGTNTTPPLYMYMNSRISAHVDAGNMSGAWTGAGNTTAPADNDVDVSAMPSIVTVDAYGSWLNTPVLGKAGVLEFNNSGTLLPGAYELKVVSGQIGQADVDFNGFTVDINLNDTVIQRRLLAGRSGYNFQGTDTFQLTLADGVAGNYLLTFDWLNPLEDVTKGTKRQLAVLGYTLRCIRTELFKVDVVAGPQVQITPLAVDSFMSGTTPGGWYTTVNSYGTRVSFQHEAAIYPLNDTVVSVYPLADTLTGTTNDRRSDVIYTGSNVVISEEGSFTFPSFGSVTAILV